MAKRYHDSDIWTKQFWFKELAPMHKLAFLYIKDQCDHAGVWTVSWANLIDDLGLKNFDLKEFINLCNLDNDPLTGRKINRERVKLIDNNTKLWITGFVQFQYQGKDKRGVRPNENGPIKTALIILSGLNVLEYAITRGYITLAQPLPEGYLTPKDKEKDKDKPLKDKGVQGEKETTTDNPEMIQKVYDLTEAICKYFSIKTVTTSKTYNSICDYVSSISHRNELDIASLSLQKYMSYKARSQEQLHNVKNWIGTKEAHYRDGEWFMTDWESKDKNFKDDRATDKGTLSAAGSVIENGKAFGKLRQH